MGNDKIKQYYDQMSQEIQTAQATRNKSPDFSRFDIEFFRKFENPDHSLLDLGAGTGLLLNNVMDSFAKVLAVELYPNFSKFIRKAAHVSVVNKDLKEFDTSEEFDILALFGLMNYFDKEEATRLYRKFFRFCRVGGTMVVKNQMGVSEDVTVDTFSEELGRQYYSNYRSVASETEIIEQAGFIVEDVVDIYPPEFNRWPNTHFYAIVAKKPRNALG